MKNRINFTLTKIDHEKAGQYTDNCGCLIATALHRRGFKNVAVVPNEVTIGTTTFHFPNNEWFGAESLGWLSQEARYDGSAIGKRLTLIKDVQQA